MNFFSVRENFKKKQQLRKILNICAENKKNLQSIRKRSPNGRKKILFIGQPEYFRQNWFDLEADGSAIVLDIRSNDLSNLAKVPELLRQNEVGLLIMFRPEWFAAFPNEFRYARDLGVLMVGFSTEPIVKSVDQIHWDELVRMKNLSSASQLPWDLLIHYDNASSEIIEAMGFSNVLYNPIPVSKLLFHPVPNVPKKFDFLFVGRSTPYRESFLMPLKAKFNTLHIAHGLYDEDVNDLMSQSKFVLNIHNENYINFETRIIQSLRARVPLLTEVFPKNFPMPPTGFVQFSSPSELFLLAENFIKNREAIACESIDIPSCYDMHWLISKIYETIKYASNR
jgi:hypothetical protein